LPGNLVSLSIILIKGQFREGFFLFFQNQSVI
jgi:hypothetical protein